MLEFRIDIVDHWTIFDCVRVVTGLMTLWANVFAQSWTSHPTQLIFQNMTKIMTIIFAKTTFLRKNNTLIIVYRYLDAFAQFQFILTDTVNDCRRLFFVSRSFCLLMLMLHEIFDGWLSVELFK